MLILLGVLGCSAPLPEEGTPAAELYRARCSGCHRAFAPSSLKYATWEMILPRMEAQIARAGRPSLTAEERRTILDYLRRHCG